MQFANSPLKWLVPFAQSDTNRVELPVTSSDPARASQSEGFPPLTMLPPESGGVPPQGEDFNGALNQVARIAWWLQAGGLFTFDATWAANAAIGGYPTGAQLLSNAGRSVLQSRLDNNQNDPNSSSSGAWGPPGNTGLEIVLSNASPAVTSLTDLQAASSYVRVTGTAFQSITIAFPAAISGAGAPLGFTFVHDAVNNGNANFVIVLTGPNSSSITVYPGQRVGVKSRNDGSLIVVGSTVPQNGFNGVQPIVGSTTLNTTAQGALLELQGSTAYTVTLPAANTFDPGGSLYFKSFNSATVTLARQGSDTLQQDATNLTATSLLLGSGDTLELTSDAAGHWMLTGGSALAQWAAAEFGRLLNTQSFVANATYTPTPGTRSIVVEMCGGGGGGGGVGPTGAGQFALSVGGFAGAYCKARFTSGFAGLAVTIGAAGAAGSAVGGNGGAGGTSTFGTLITCSGGVGGAGGAAAAFAASVATPAGAQSSASSSGALYSVRGGLPSPSVAISATAMFGGAGGASFFGQGGNTSQLNGNGNGSSNRGTGGSGVASGASEAGFTGGPGQIGVCTIWEYA